MKNKLFYIIISAAALICFNGCGQTAATKNGSAAATENSSENDVQYSKKREAIEYHSPSESETNADSIVTVAPKQTVKRITAINDNSDPTTENQSGEKNNTAKVTGVITSETAAETSAVQQNNLKNKNTTKMTAETKSRWFSAHTLFKMDTMEEDNAENDETWYHFRDFNETTHTTVDVNGFGN